ncbi:MAG: ATP-binding protein [Leptospirales bacterium]
MRKKNQSIQTYIKTISVVILIVITASIVVWYWNVKSENVLTTRQIEYNLVSLHNISEINQQIRKIRIHELDHSLQTQKPAPDTHTFNWDEVIYELNHLLKKSNKLIKLYDDGSIYDTNRRLNSAYQKFYNKIINSKQQNFIQYEYIKIELEEFQLVLRQFEILHSIDLNETEKLLKINNENRPLYLLAFFVLIILPSIAFVKYLYGHIGTILVEQNTLQKHISELNAKLEKRVLLRTRELTESQDQLKLIINTAADAIITMNNDGTILSFNKAAEKLFFWQENKIIGKKINLIVEGSDSWFNKKKKNSEIDRYEAIGIRKKKTKFPIYYSLGQTIINNNIIYTALIYDLTERKKAENDLLDSETRLIKAQKIAHLGSMEWDFDKDQQVWSEELYHIFNIPVENTNPTIEDLLSMVIQDDLALVKKTISKNAKSSTSFNIEFGLLRTDSTIRTIHSQGKLISSSNKAPSKMSAIFQDISELKSIQSELENAKIMAESANIAKSQFLANMSHEIRTPMNSILGFIDLSLESSQLNDRIRANLTIANRSAKSLLVLIDDILDTSKLEAGKLEIEIQKYHLPRLLKDVIQTLKLKSDEKAVQLNLDVQHDIYHCFIGDPNRIRQILTNLVGNAIKFTKKGVVSLSVIQIKNNYLEFKITDTGIGMTPHQLKTIFQPFKQGDQTTARRYGGSGLGTTISKQLVKLMGGKIWAKSKPNNGSTFYFTLKQETPSCLSDCSLDCEDHGYPGEILLPQSKRSFKILLAEDIPENAALATLRLEQQNHSIDTCVNGREALELFKKRQYDIILMDIQMPIMDGNEATQRIRAMEAKAKTKTHIPIIALTASVMESDKRKCIEAGVDIIIEKPIDFGRLFRTMEELATKSSGVYRKQIGVDIKDKKFDLPDKMEGINVEKGIRIWLNYEEYSQSLLSYSQHYKKAPTKLKQYIDANKFEEAYSLIHALKGVSGNLSIEDVASTAIKLDLLIKKKEVDNINKLLPVLSKQMKIAIASIRKIKKHSPKKNVLINKLKSSNVKDDIKTLIELYKSGELNDKLLSDLMQKLQAQISKSVLKRLQNHVDNYDFNDAIDILKSFE